MSYQVGSISPTMKIAGPDGVITPEFHRFLTSLMSLVRFSGLPQFGIMLYDLTAAEEAAYFDANGVGKAGTPLVGKAQCLAQTLTIDGASRTLPNIAAAAMRIY